MPIAKEVLRNGFTVVANPGTYVTKEAVEKYGWQDQVDDGPDVGGTTETTTKDRKAPKGPAQKGA